MPDDKMPSPESSGLNEFIERAAVAEPARPKSGLRSEKIARLRGIFENKAIDFDGVEAWLARDLQPLLGYSEWRNFQNVITKAKEACERVGADVSDHFVDVNKVIEKGKGAREERGVDDKGFAIIRSRGDAALFGGASTLDMKRKLQVPKTRPLADFLPTVTIKAKDLAAEITNYMVKTSDISGHDRISKEHESNNRNVRGALTNSGIYPESLPPAEDIKKIERRLKSEEKNYLKSRLVFPSPAISHLRGSRVSSETYSFIQSMNCCQLLRAPLPRRVLP